jgi:hypothetical protein
MWGKAVLAGEVVRGFAARKTIADNQHLIRSDLCSRRHVDAP